MISFKELLSKNPVKDPPIEHRLNMGRLHYVLNFIRRLYGQPMVITSGYRTAEEHFSIYQKINKERVLTGKPELSVPMGSCHLIGASADIYDPDGKLKEWVLKNRSLCEDLCVYFEDFKFTPTWVHLQIYPPSSGERFFKP